MKPTFTISEIESLAYQMDDKTWKYLRDVIVDEQDRYSPIEIELICRIMTSVHNVMYEECN